MRSQRKELLITWGSWGRLLGGGDIYIGSQWLSGSYTTWRRGSSHSCQRHRSMLWFLRLAPDMGREVEEEGGGQIMLGFRSHGEKVRLSQHGRCPAEGDHAGWCLEQAFNHAV